MRTPLSRAAAGVFVAMLLAWLALPMATASAATAKNVSNAEEAWFLQNKEPLADLEGGDPTCELDTGCNLAGNATRRNEPHPEGVLVVAANAGKPDAQTFFTFNLEPLGLGALVTGGTVTLPVARDSQSGNFRAANAQMVACLTTGYVPSGTDGGSWKDRPTYDENTCVPLKLTKDDPGAEVFTVGLERFGKAWSAAGATNSGITILPDPGATGPDQTWRVVFNSTRRAQQETAKQKENPAETPVEYPAITSSLEYKVEKIPCFFNCPGDETTAGGGGFEDTSGGGDFSTDTGTASSGDTGSFGSSGTPTTGTGVTPSTGTGTAPVAPPVAAGNSGQVAAGGTVPTAANPPGMSPAVWITPLLALAAAAAMAWSLMQPVELAGQREGAVSRLMRTRRLKAAPTNPS